MVNARHVLLHERRMAHSYTTNQRLTELEITVSYARICWIS